MTSKKSPNDAVIEALIESELSASETYQQAIERVGEERGSGELRRIESEHRQAACILRERCQGAAAATQGAWSAWAGAMEAPDAQAAIRALRAGEEHEIREYERALESPRVPDHVRTLIASTLLPQTRSHLPILDRFLRAGG